MTGLLEVITNADSIDGIKKKLGPERRFIEKFKELFPEPDRFAACQRAYMESLAGSSLACYILRMGDRHNGNIMVEMLEGRLAHIDFGFVMGMRPGKDKVPYTDFSFERAAFKLTSEMVEVLGGQGSPLYEEMIKIMSDGLIAVRHEAETLITLLEITGFKSMFPCFRQPGGGVSRVIKELKQRLFLDLPDDKIPAKMRYLVESSYMAMGTILYEKFQQRSNGLAPIY
jgi:phosphatidylinositol 4-kinase